jgi:hypothetical protein
MVTAVSLEFLRKFDTSASQAADDDEEADREPGDEAGDDDDGRNDDGRDRDLAEAGDDWLGEQGFDSLKS